MTRHPVEALLALLPVYRIWALMNRMARNALVKHFPVISVSGQLERPLVVSVSTTQDLVREEIILPPHRYRADGHLDAVGHLGLCWAPQDAPELFCHEAKKKRRAFQRNSESMGLDECRCTSTINQQQRTFALSSA
jgi:hypothetical protein